MSLYSYVVKTPFSVICEDVKEYVRLRQKEHFLNNECKYLLKNLKVKDGNTYGCIRQTDVKQPGGVNSEPLVQYCENFFNKECNLECPAACKQNKYWRLVAERKEAITKRAEFWDKKLQNVK